MSASLESRFTFTAKAIPVLFAVLMVGSVALLSAIGEFDLIFYGSYAIISFAAALSLVYVSRRDQDWAKMTLGRQSLVVSMAGFFFSIAALVIILRAGTYRTLVVFGLLTFAGGIILAQIAYLQDTTQRRWCIILQLMIYHIALIYSLSLNYWYFVGGTDVILHNGFVRMYLRDGALPQSTIYRDFPLWHFLMAMTIKLTNTAIPIHRLAPVVSGLVFTAVPPFGYAIARRMDLAPGSRLLAAFFMTINVSILYYGAYSIPRSFVLIQFLAVIFLLFRPHEWRTIIVFVALTAAIVAYHPASPPFIAVLLGGVYIARVIYSHLNQTGIARLGPLSAILFLTVSMYWVFFAETTVYALALTLFLAPPSVSGFATTTSNTAELMLRFWGNVPYLILLTTLLYAIMVVLPSNPVSDTKKLIVVLGLGAAAVTFPNPLTIFDQFQQLNFDRWGIYTPAFVSVAAAIGVEAIRRRLGPIGRHFVVVALVVLLFASITGPVLAGDNPHFDAGVKTPYLTQEETTALRHTADLTPGFVMTDYVATRYLDASQWPETSHIMLVDPERKTPVTGTTGHILLIRQNELRNRGLDVYPTQSYTYRPGLGQAERTHTVRITPTKYHKPYSVGESVGYVKREHQ